MIPGCLDMVNLGPHQRCPPSKFKERKFYPHNPNANLMRTDVDENQRLGEILATKLK